MSGVAAPNPLRRHGLPVAGLAPVAPLMAACQRGSNARAGRAWRTSHHRQRARAARRRTTRWSWRAAGWGAGP